MPREDSQFQQAGVQPVGKPICVRFDPDTDEKLRAMPDRSDFIRRAVAAMLP
jgi:hypothetical protein